MSTNLKLQTMGQTPSLFGMPTYGPTSGASFGIARSATICATGVSVARDRHVATADWSLVKGAFPGTSAWRPPTC